MKSSARLFILLGALTPLAHAQIEFYHPSPFVVWMQHFGTGENTCILVRPDASYHLERTENQKQVVYAGLLSADELKELRSLLDENEFAAIKTTDVKNPLIMSSFDQFGITVPRKDTYQRLSFTNEGSRKPFRKSLNPILSWFNKIKVDKRSIHSTELLNGCFPDPATNAPSKTLNATSSDTASRTPGFDFLVHVAIDHFVNDRLTRTCVGIFPTGTYRVEDTSQSISGPMHVKVYEGTLTVEQVSTLRNLLDAPDLASTVHRNIPQGVAMKEGTATRVEIPRSDYVQNLIFYDYVQISTGSLAVSLQSGSKSTDQAEQVIQPLREWIRNNVEEHRGRPIKDAAANGCSATSSAEKH